MNFLPERGYDMSHAHPSFRATVEALQWEKFVEHRAFYLEQIVREFYAGMITNSGKILTDHSVVRGKKVMFDEATINKHYNLRFTGTTFEERYDNYGKNKMEQIKSRVAIPDCEWDKFSHNEFKLKIKYIIPECNWHSFINCSIMPTSHNYTLPKDRLIILDCILNDEQINIGKIINKEIRDCAKKTDGFLFFPCLITELCMNHEVQISENELLQKKIPPTPLSAAMKPRRVSLAPEMSKKKGKAEKVEEGKEEKDKDIAVKRFLLDQHEWIKKRFEEISQEPSALEVPEFPIWIFESIETEKEPEKEKEPVEKEAEKKKKKVMKRKKSPARRGNVKKRKIEKEWIDIEESDEEEAEAELEKNEKESDEGNTATEGSVDMENEGDLDLTMEELLRKKKGKSPVLEQIDPPIQSPIKSPTIPTPPSTPPSTGTTPPPPSNADVTQEEKETEKTPPKEKTPPIEQATQKTPPLQEDQPIISPNIAVESTVLQVPEDVPMPQKTPIPEGEKTAATAAEATASASAQGASAPISEPAVTEVVEGDLQQTLNLVVTELAEKMREEFGKRMIAATSRSKKGEEPIKEAVTMGMETEPTTEEAPKEGEAEKSTNEEDKTLKEAAETLKDLTKQVEENTADISKATETLSAEAAEEPAPEVTPAKAPDTTPGATTPVVTPGAEKSGSKGGRKPPKPKPTPTRSSSRLRSGAKP